MTWKKCSLVVPCEYPRSQIFFFYNVVESPSHVSPFATPWTVAHQAPLSMGFLRPEHWHGLPFPSPEDLPSPEVELRSAALAGRLCSSSPPAAALPSFPTLPKLCSFYLQNVIFYLSIDGMANCSLVVSCKYSRSQNFFCIM